MKYVEDSSNDDAKSIEYDPSNKDNLTYAGFEGAMDTRLKKTKTRIHIGSIYIYTHYIS